LVTEDLKPRIIAPMVLEGDLRIGGWGSLGWGVLQYALTSGLGSSNIPIIPCK